MIYLLKVMLNNPWNMPKEKKLTERKTRVRREVENAKKYILNSKHKHTFHSCFDMDQNWSCFFALHKSKDQKCRLKMQKKFWQWTGFETFCC